MAPRRGFTDEAVAEAAMRVFWARGYRATSIDDLARAAGIRKGSLHHAFGNKEDLFLLALDRYADDLSERLDGALDDPDPSVAVPGFFDAVVARITDPRSPAGCLTTSACMEHGELPPRVQERVADSVSRIIEVLAQHARSAVDLGLLPPGTDPDVQAKMWFAVTRGMAALHKVTGDEVGIRRIAEEAVKPLRRNPPQA